MLEGDIYTDDQIIDAAIFTSFPDSDLNTFKKRNLLTVH